MYLLAKHQSKGSVGFKRFVQNLVGMESDRRAHILQLASLEDPVYTLWVIKNIYDINILFKLGKEYFPDLFGKLKKNLEIFVRAFKDTPEEYKFLEEYLDEGTAKNYQEMAQSMGRIPAAATQGTRILILEALHELQSLEIIQEIKWELPSEKIINGVLPSEKVGNFSMSYNKSMLALQGKYVEKMREGRWLHFYPQNKLMAEGFYHQNEKVDDWIFYYPNGKKQEEGRYKEDLRHGKWQQYGMDGAVTEVEYIRGKLIAQKKLPESA